MPSLLSKKHSIEILKIFKTHSAMCFWFAKRLPRYPMHASFFPFFCPHQKFEKAELRFWCREDGRRKADMAKTGIAVVTDLMSTSCPP